MVTHGRPGKFAGAGSTAERRDPRDFEQAKSFVIPGHQRGRKIHAKYKMAVPISSVQAVFEHPQRMSAIHAIVRGRAAGHSKKGPQLTEATIRATIEEFRQKFNYQK